VGFFFFPKKEGEREKRREVMRGKVLGQQGDEETVTTWSREGK